MIKALFFDFDGTLCDSSEGIFSSALETMKHFSHDISGYTKEDLKKFIGPPIGDCFRLTFHSNEDEIPRLVEYFRKLYKDDGMYKMKVYPGIKETLNSLKKDGYILAVATSKLETIVKECVKNLELDEYFDLISGSTNDDEKKCDVIARSLKELSLYPREVIMVGDTDNDMVGSNVIGVHFLPILWGFGFSKEKYPGYIRAEKPEDILTVVHSKVFEKNE